MQEFNKYLVVGLGNPGKKYEMTRHNIGFKVVEELTEQRGFKFTKDKTLKSEIAKGQLKERVVYLVKPQTYMNASGEAVMLCMNYYQIAPENLLIVTDDFALPFGILRLRGKGSSGGHNGLNDIELHLKTQEYSRLRIGVGDPGQKSWPDYVLEEFNAAERKAMPEVLQKAAVAVELWLEKGIVSAMKDVNTIKLEKVD